VVVVFSKVGFFFSRVEGVGFFFSNESCATSMKSQQRHQTTENALGLPAAHALVERGPDSHVRARPEPQPPEHVVDAPPPLVERRGLCG